MIGMHIKYIDRVEGGGSEDKTGVVAATYMAKGDTWLMVQEGDSLDHIPAKLVKQIL